MKLSLTHAALADLRAIRAYTLETWGHAQEQNYLDRIWARFESIRDAPERFLQRPDLFPGCRIASEGRHLILFRCGQDSLEIVRVLHSAMDLKRHL
jgi:toxin ParE1/3/4